MSLSGYAIRFFNTPILPHPAHDSTILLPFFGYFNTDFFHGNG
jgi:hypothetical protein